MSPLRHWIVPIRYWETDELEIIDVEHRDGKHVYGFHHGYGHNVYVDLERVFCTPELALAETTRLRAKYEADLDAEAKEIVRKVFEERNRG